MKTNTYSVNKFADRLSNGWLDTNNYYVKSVKYIRTMFDNDKCVEIKLSDWSDKYKGGVAHVDGMQLTKKRIKLTALKSIFKFI